MDGDFASADPRVTLQRLTVRDGYSADGGGGAVYFVGGTVVVIDSVFLDNVGVPNGPDLAGGAIYAVGVGELIVSGSRFAGNRCANGGAIGILAPAITVVSSTLVDNVATGEQGSGGAIYMDGQGRRLYVCGSTLQGNSAGAHGGAIFRTGYATEPNEIHQSSILDNETRDHGGQGSGLQSAGGALYLQGVHVNVTASTVAGNRASGSAGVWVLAHNEVPAVIDLTNVTITGNSTHERDDFTTRGVAAGVTVGDGTTGTLLNVTIVGNEAQFGAGVWNASPLTIHNSILSNVADNEWTPLNCSGRDYAGPPASGGANVQWPNGVSEDDMDCTADIVRLDLMMGALADNGGPTQTRLPGAVGLPEGTDCPETDQRGAPRGEPCTIGAVELP